MKWWLLASVLLLAACDKKVEMSDPHHTATAISSVDYTPPPVIKSMRDVPDPPVDILDHCAEHAAIQEDLTDTVNDLREVALQLDSVGGGGVGGGPTVGVGTLPAKVKPNPSSGSAAASSHAVKAKVQRKETVKQQDAIQMLLIDAQEQADKLDKMSPRELRKKLREMRRGER